MIFDLPCFSGYDPHPPGVVALNSIFGNHLEWTCVRRRFGGAHTDKADLLDVAALRDLSQEIDSGDQPRAANQRRRSVYTLNRIENDRWWLSRLSKIAHTQIKESDLCRS
jgi:hypothetical protein